MTSNRARQGATGTPDALSILEGIVLHIGQLLPAQGPMGVFVHHNTLHAFEHLPFDDALSEATQLLGGEPYLSESRYREELRRGRIQELDLVAEIQAELGERGDEPLFPPFSRSELRRRIVVHGIPDRSGPSLRWTLEETAVLTRLRTDLPFDARQAVALGLGGRAQRGEEESYVRALWLACRRGAQRTQDGEGPIAPAPLRHRDLLLRAFDFDIDEWVHPTLIRVTSAFLDQGIADWPMPGRERGLYHCFLETYRQRIARLCRPLGKVLQDLVSAEQERAHDSWGSLECSLVSLGIPLRDWQSFLLGESLALRGFAGMMRQFELRPDRVPTTPVPARLVDFLAIRLLILRAAIAHAALTVGFQGEVAALREWIGRRLPESRPRSVDERAWPLFHLAQLLGLSANDIDALPALAIERVESEFREFDTLARRRVFHRAYERQLRHRFFDAVIQHRPAPQPEQPRYQAIFCIDDREESIRRHLEEVDAQAETFGVAGFFGVAMYYQAATDAHPRPLCPVAIRPRHVVRESEPACSTRLRERLARGWTAALALADKNVHIGGRHARRGAFLFATIGVLWVIPLVLGVVFPWLRRAAARLYNLPRPRGRLLLELSADASQPFRDAEAGFTPEEMAEIVFAQLAPIGIRDRFASLVLVFGHGSAGLNNPHRSAYDCGACGGGHGGPNARAFAQMANDARVRKLLAEWGMIIPAQTWFVGGERNTTSNDLTLFDEDLIPAEVRGVAERAKRALDETRRRESHERARRFESAGLWLPPAATLVHVQARAEDLAQPRPECGHATNAVCFVGRRQRTRGLFLDRRAFLVSYDGTADPEGERLARVLSAVVPVVAGISLEYFFSYMDSAGFGAGTKLPHNVTALVGVMDGAQSDLRTGLPWQMVEIHEPVRLSIVVEASATVVRRLLGESGELKHLVDNGWVYLAALEPATAQLTEITSALVKQYTPERPLPVCHGDSRQHYFGRRGHLPFARIMPSAESAA